MFAKISAYSKLIFDYFDLTCARVATKASTRGYIT